VYLLLLVLSDYEKVNTKHIQYPNHTSVVQAAIQVYIQKYLYRHHTPYHRSLINIHHMIDYTCNHSNQDHILWWNNINHYYILHVQECNHSNQDSYRLWCLIRRKMCSTFASICVLHRFDGGSRVTHMRKNLHCFDTIVPHYNVLKSAEWKISWS